MRNEPVAPALPATGPSCRGALTVLLEAAVRAPSGDNLQPWRFAVDAEAGEVVITVDEARDRSPMNAGQRMARIAVGAALENMLAAAEHNGGRATARLHPSPLRAVFRLTDAPNAAGGCPGPVLARQTNRRCYDGRLITPALRGRLEEAAPPLEGVRTCWLTDRSRLPAWADLVGRADAVTFGEASMRRAFLGSVRFGARRGTNVPEGLSPHVLEMGWAQRQALELFARLPDRAADWAGLPRQAAAHSRRLVSSASGLCLVVAPDGREVTDLLVGRSVQRVWLALTAAGLAAQPMMSPLVLENAAENGGPELVASLGPERLQALRDELRRLAPEVGTGRPAFLLRFGFAPPPAERTGRLSHLLPGAGGSVRRSRRL